MEGKAFGHVAVWTVLSLAADTSTPFTVSASATAPASVTTLAIAFSANIDPNPSNNVVLDIVKVTK
jgi:hypothetical protein